MKIIPTIVIIYGCVLRIGCKTINYSSASKNTVINDQDRQSSIQRIGASLQQPTTVNMSYLQFLFEFKPQLINRQSKQQYDYRTSVFNKNKQTINKHNLTPNKTYFLKITKFSDLTYDQFRATYSKLTIPDITPNKQIVDWSCLLSPPLNLNCQESYPKAALDSIQITLAIHETPYKLFNPEITYCGKKTVSLFQCRGRQIETIYAYVKKFGVGVLKQQYSKETKENLERLQCGQIMRNQQYRKNKLFIKGFKVLQNDTGCLQLLKQLPARSPIVFVDDSFINNYSYGVYRNPIITKDGKLTPVIVIGYQPSQRSLMVKGNFGGEWGHSGNGFIGVNTGICSLVYFPILYQQQENPKRCP